MNAQGGFAGFLFGVFCLQMGFFGACFAYFAWKGTQPVKARSKVLLVAQFIGLFTFGVYFWVLLQNIADTCAIRFGTVWVLSYGLIAALFVRVLRLFFIFNLNKSRLEDASAQPSFFTNPQIVSERSLFLIFLGIFSFFLLYRVGTLLYLVIHDNIPSSEACENPAPYMGIIGIVCIIIGLVVIGYKLRRVHDAYYIKTEFTIVMFVAIIILPFYILTLAIRSRGALYQASCWIVLFLCNALATASYGIPSYLAFKNMRMASNSLSDSVTVTATTSKEEDLEEASTDRKVFDKYGKAREWVKDPVAMRHIEKYILHYQDITSGDYLLFWNQLYEFSKVQDEFLTAKASLLYQKFIKKDAYRYIGFITEAQRKKIEEMLEDGMKENAPPVSREIFDEVMQETEELLIQRVFKGFYHSVFYREYKEAVLLKSSNL